jgi:hypothetical protein
MSKMTLRECRITFSTGYPGLESEIESVIWIGKKKKTTTEFMGVKQDQG